jgi:chromate transporter
LTPEPAAPEKPRSATDLFVTFTRLALMGFGGVLPIAQFELVERKRWMTKEQFVEMLSLAQVLPGPNVVNLALMFGDRHFGLRGAFAAVAGMLTVPLVIVLALAALHGRHAGEPQVAGALRGMVIATALKLWSALRRNPLGQPLCLALAALTGVAVVGLRWPLAGVIAGLGTLACALAWRRIAP